MVCGFFVRALYGGSSGRGESCRFSREVTAHAVMGCARHCNDGDGWPEFDRDALAGTMHRLAERLAIASAALQNAVYGGVTSSTQQPVTAAREACAAAAAPKSAV